MNLLLTNDDGWGFEGLKSLEHVASQFGTVWIVAPTRPMSGISHQMTFERPMSFVENEPRSFALDGTPADCVRVGLTQLGVSFDWVLSGINKGANLGSDIYVSGTVAAAREASLFGCRSIAFSQHLRNFQSPYEWSIAAELTTKILPSLFDNRIQQGEWANVNFPDFSQSNTGQRRSDSFVETKLDRNPLPTDYTRMDDGRLIYSSLYNDRTRTAGHDIDVCFSGTTSITFHR